MRRERIARAVAAATTELVTLTLTTTEPLSSAADLRLLDAHTHVMIENITPDEEVALLKKAGIDQVIFMHTDVKAVAALGRKYPGFVIPSLGVARAGVNGLHLDGRTGAIVAPDDPAAQYREWVFRDLFRTPRDAAEAGARARAKRSAKTAKPCRVCQRRRVGFVHATDAALRSVRVSLSDDRETTRFPQGLKPAHVN